MEAALAAAADGAGLAAALGGLLMTACSFSADKVRKSLIC